MDRDADDVHGLGVLAQDGPVLAGRVVGYTTKLHEAALAMLVAFLAGGVILNVLKEEVPAERSSRFGALALGMALCSAVLPAL